MNWPEFLEDALYVLVWAVVTALACLVFFLVLIVGFSLMFGGHHA